jgi:hypothetical protein
MHDLPENLQRCRGQQQGKQRRMGKRAKFAGRLLVHARMEAEGASSCQRISSGQSDFSGFVRQIILKILVA